MTSEEIRMLLSRDRTSINLLPEIPEALEKALHPSTRRQFVAALLCQGAKTRQKGEEDLELAARLAPDFHGPPTMLGGYWALRDDFARAEKDLGRAIELAPFLPGLYAARASDRMVLGKPGSLEDIDEALRLAPNAPRFHHIKGLVLYRAYRFADAASSFGRSIDGAPKSAEYRIFRAMAYERLKNYAASIEDCTKAIELAPAVAKYHERRAKLWAMVGDEPKYEADLRKAKELSGSR